MNLCILSACYDQPERAAILTESCLINRLPLLWCSAKEWKGSWRVPGDYRTGKLQAAYETIQAFRKWYDHFMWIDGFDSFVQAGSPKIEAAWNALQCPPLVLSAEKNCYPYPAWADNFPTVEGPYRFLCAGAWMGQTGYLIDSLEQVLKWSPRDERNDQPLWQNFYLGNRLPGAVIDSGRRIFQSMFDVPDSEAIDAPVVHYNGEASWNKSTRYQEHWQRVKASK